MNVAIVTTGLVVFDCETAEKAELVLKNCGETSHMCSVEKLMNPWLFSVL